MSYQVFSGLFNQACVEIWFDSGLLRPLRSCAWHRLWDPVCFILWALSFTMSSLPSKFFPFNGECELSKGGDLTLHFPDGSTLQTHSSLLALVSPVLKTAIEDCQHSEGIKLAEECLTWQLALNLMHPDGPILCEEEITDKRVSFLVVWIQSSILAF